MDAGRAIEAEVRARIHQDVEPVWKPKSKLELSFLIDCLQNHFIFNNLSPVHLEAVAKSMLYAEVHANKVIFDEGWEADSFFVIENGAFQVLLNGRVGRTLVAPQGFGETALLSAGLRTSSVRAKVKSYVWLIDRVSFREAVEQAITEQYEHNRQYLQKLRFFPYLSNQIKDLISASLVELRFKKGQLIVEEDDPGSSFYIVRQGTVIALAHGKEVGRLGPGDFFGQNALYYNVVRKVSMRADQPVVCLGLGRQSLIRILPDFHKVVFQNLIRAAVDRSELLQDLSQQRVAGLLQAFNITSYQAGERLVAKGQQKTNLLVVVQGFVKRSWSGATVGRPGDLVAQRVALGLQPANDDYVMESDGVVVSIDLSGKQLFDEQQVLSIPQLRFPIQQITQVHGTHKLTLGQLLIAEGQQKIAVKRIGIQELKQEADRQSLQREAQCLGAAGGGFVVSLRGVWQSKMHHFLAMQYVQGPSLYQIMRAIGLLSTRDCQFFVTNMLLGLKRLREARVVHRDLKPQNWVADGQGFLRLVGFSCSKRLANQRRTNTVVGTPHYMAPEVITGKSYGLNADMWSLGVIFYEMMCGGVPFGDQLSSPYEIFDAVMRRDLSFPHQFKDRRAKRLIQTFLNRAPEFRMTGSFPLLLRDDWLAEVRPDDLAQRLVRPPQLPAGLRAKVQLTTSVPKTWLQA